MNKKTVLLIALILGTAFWGISFSVTRIGIGHSSLAVFLFYRFLVASLALSVVFFKYFKQMNLAAIKTGAQLAIPLVLGIYLQTLGIKHTSASQCAFVAGCTVIIIPVLKRFLYQVLVPAKIWAAALIALTGLFIISIKENFAISTGDWYTIMGAIGFAFYLIHVEKKSAAMNLIPTFVPMFVTCTLAAFLLALPEGKVNWLPQDNDFWIGIGYCALFSTAYMYSVSNIAQRYISAEKVAIIYLLEPVFGAIAAFFILGEGLTWRLLLGGSLIILGTVISEIRISRRALT